MIDDRHLATSPESVGIDSEKLEAVFARAKRDVDDGDENGQEYETNVGKQRRVSGSLAFTHPAMRRTFSFTT